MDSSALDDDFCVALDATDGTIEGTTAGLDLRTRCYDGALACDDIDELRRDLAFAASPLVPNDTFWIGAADEPRCALEALALEIFRAHAGSSPFAADAKSGAEWWAQVKTTASADEAEREVSFHWDKGDVPALNQHQSAAST